MFLRNLNQLEMPHWFKEIIMKELQHPCCEGKKCVLQASYHLTEDLLVLMKEAKRHKEQLQSHRAEVSVDTSSGLAPRKLTRKPAKVKGLSGTSELSRERAAEVRVSKMHTKNVVRDHLGQRRSSVSKLRDAFLEDHVATLRGEGNFCMVAIQRMLFSNEHDLYGGPVPALMDRLDLREQRLRGTRKARGLPALNTSEDPTDTRTFENSSSTLSTSSSSEDINDCCTMRCSHYGRKSNAKLWERFEKISSLGDEIDFYAGMMWDSRLGRVSSMCFAHMVSIR